MDAAISGRDKLDAYINSIKTLPPAPSLMLKLLALLKESNPDIDEVISLARSDPAITLEILRISNGARFRGEQSLGRQLNFTTDDN